MKITATIEARMTSTRLPGKVLLEAAGKPMLEHLVNRIKSVSSLDAIVLATTTNAADDVLADFAMQQGIECFRGSEDDVMSRVIGAGQSSKADLLVELTGDNPLIDPGIVEQCIGMFKRNECDYLSNTVVKSYPSGMDTQVFPLSILEKSASMTDDPLDHEHVSLHIRQNPNLFRQINLLAPSQLYWPDLALTLDEKADYELLKKIIEHFADINPLFSCYELVQFLRTKTDWVAINTHVRRKGAS